MFTTIPEDYESPRPHTEELNYPQALLIRGSNLGSTSSSRTNIGSFFLTLGVANGHDLVELSSSSDFVYEVVHEPFLVDDAECRLNPLERTRVLKFFTWASLQEPLELTSSVIAAVTTNDLRTIPAPVSPSVRSMVPLRLCL